MNILKILNLF